MTCPRFRPGAGVAGRTGGPLPGGWGPEEISSPNGRAPDRIKSTDDDARKVMDRVASRFRDEQPVFTRMDDDWDLWVLEKWQPESDDSISAEDAYTTNAPRVLAQKIIAFISATELIVRVPHDDAPKPQEMLNDAAESLAIGIDRKS